MIPGSLRRYYGGSITGLPLHEERAQFMILSSDLIQGSVVVIGSGFGGTTTALTMARAFKRRGMGERLLILERDT